MQTLLLWLFYSRKNYSLGILSNFSMQGRLHSTAYKHITMHSLQNWEKRCLFIEYVIQCLPVSKGNTFQDPSYCLKQQIVPTPTYTFFFLYIHSYDKVYFINQGNSYCGSQQPQHTIFIFFPNKVEKLYLSLKGSTLRLLFSL